MNRTRPFRLALGLALAGLAAAAGARTSPAAASLGELLAGHSLVLVCRLDTGDPPFQFLDLLADLATVYGPHGLGVAIAAPDGPWQDAPAAAGLRRLRDGGDAAARPALALHRGDGSVLVAMDGHDVDLYPIYRRCERELRGRRHVSLLDHVREVLGRALAAEVEPTVPGGDGERSLAELLQDHPDGCLLLPPGCTSCLLDKHALALAALLAERPAIPALVFEADAGDGLERFGWRGAAHLLAAGAEARLLALRQAVHYAPVVVSRREDGGLAVRPLPAADDS